MDMTMCGRIYQNPLRPTEIYINIGWNTKGKQLYPQYEPWMAAQGISQAEYNQIISAVREEFDNNAPISNICIAQGAMCLCMATCGVLFCGCLWLKMKVDSFNNNAKELVTGVSNNKMSLSMVEMAGAQHGAWVDSKGAPLLVRMGRGTQPGGPPLGYNLIFSTQSPIPWPPAAGMQPALATVVGAPVVANAVVVEAPMQQGMGCQPSSG
uniref:Uncharacterized protein n=1 Tax=Alexandrium monilatum TaxID=311494 RepID=A0A7S4QAV3_9DINO|mmetsp:Transcript_106968/g.319885  ORF Transcript_106968/g.319885 Transcript_106968/m.319885 type:complete len:210 (+) Transcript_106968:99-728(+)